MKPACRTPTRTRGKADQGFSLIEVMIVLLLGALLMSVAGMSARSGQLAFRANGAQARLKGKLHTAREYALSHQRPVLLVFTADGRLLFNEVDSAVSQPEIVDLAVQFEGDMGFGRLEGQGTVQDELCETGGTTVLNGREGLRFNPEGRLVDADAEPVSGCFYLADNTSTPTMSRAISLFGPTGRLRTFEWRNDQWAR